MEPRIDKKKHPLEAFLMNQSPSQAEAAYFQTFFPLCMKLFKKHNKLLSSIKRE